MLVVAMQAQATAEQVSAPLLPENREIWDTARTPCLGAQRVQPSASLETREK